MSECPPAGSDWTRIGLASEHRFGASSNETDTPYLTCSSDFSGPIDQIQIRIDLDTKTVSHTH